MGYQFLKPLKVHWFISNRIGHVLILVFGSLDFDWWRFFPALIMCVRKCMLLLCVQGRLWGKPEPPFSIVIAASRVHFRTHLTEITGNVLEHIYSISSSASYLQTRNGRNYIIRGKPKTRAGCSMKALASPPTDSRPKALSKLAPLWAAYGRWGQSQRKGTDKCPSNACLDFTAKLTINPKQNSRQDSYTRN